MKKLIAIAAVMVVALSASAQGTIDFRNRVTTATPPINAPIFDISGGALAQAGVVAELYWAPVGSTSFTIAKALDGSTATPVNVSNAGAAAGYWGANGDRLVGVAIGANVQLRVQAWDSTAGTFAQAQAPGSGKKWGMSSIFTVAAGDPGGSGSPPSTPAPALMQGLTSFNLQIPEPSTIALGLLGAGALLLRRRK